MKVHNQITRGDLSGAVMRALGDSKGAGGVERYSETLDLVMDPWGRPEWAYLRAERLCQGFTSEAADVANFSNCQLMNPAGSGMLVVVERIWIVAVVVTSFNVEHTTVATTTLQTGQSHPRDSRYLPLTAIVAQVRHGVSAAALGTPVNQIRILQGDSKEDVVGYVLSPGNSILVRPSAINLGLNVSFAWRERKAYPGELV